MFAIGATVFIAAAVNALKTNRLNGQLMIGALALMGVSVFLPGSGGDSKGR